MSNEDFVKYLWKFQKFEKQNLLSVEGQKIEILKTGFTNTDAGPDFSHARIMIDGIEWAGNVEIHVKTSEWFQHRHESNLAYENVILHVVWEADKAVFRADGSQIPTLELKNRTDKKLIQKTKELVDNQLVIPCQNQFEGISSLTKRQALDTAMMQRLQIKADLVYQKWEANNRDWEQTTYEILARNFGFKINAEPFEQLASNLPIKILQKHKENLSVVEAMIFGLAGFLNQTSADDYQANLAKEFEFYQAKFSLSNKQLNKSEWKFLRLRPANFPTIRLAQFANLIHQQKSFFSLFTETKNYEEICRNLATTQSDYWQQHYDFAKQPASKMAGLGKASIENIIINSVIPILFAYGQSIDNQELKDRAIAFLEEIKSEKNHITDFWKTNDLPIKTAFDSQASIELFNNFCAKKRCLECAIGIKILG
jgi:hypothetical protein